jgi:hypothetical protein
LVSDFAVILSILIFVGVDEYFMLETPKLIVPTVFKVHKWKNLDLSNLIGEIPP